MGKVSFDSGRRTEQPKATPIGCHDQGTAKGEICCQDQLKLIKQQIAIYCCETQRLLSDLSKQGPKGTEWIAQLPAQQGKLPVSAEIREFLKSVSNSPFEIGTKRNLLESLCTEISQASAKSLSGGGRREQFFVLDPNKGREILYVTSLNFIPIKGWIRGVKIAIEDKLYDLRIIDSRSSEALELTEGQAPARVSFKDLVPAAPK